MYFLFCVLSCVSLLLLGGTITEIKQPYSFAETFLQCYPRHFILAVLYLYFYVIVLIIFNLTTIITITVLQLEGIRNYVFCVCITRKHISTVPYKKIALLINTNC